MNKAAQLAEQMSALVTQVLLALQKDDNGSERITDFHIQTSVVPAQVSILDDDDHTLASVQVDECAEADSEDFREAVRATLKQQLAARHEHGDFDTLNVFRPFSFIMADALQDSKADTQQDCADELLIVTDSDTIVLSDDLLKGLDSELDSFLERLMAD